jgi:hypothetical protein
MIDLYVEPIAESEPPNGQGGGGSLGSEPKSQESMTQPPSAQPAASQSYVPDSVVSFFGPSTPGVQLIARCHLRRKHSLGLLDHA